MNAPIPSLVEPSRAVRIPAGAANLEGNLTMPARARGIVLFAHGSGSGRFSPRNQFVAGDLQTAGMATLCLMSRASKRRHSIDKRESCGSISTCWPIGWSRPPIGSCRTRISAVHRNSLPKNHGHRILVLARSQRGRIATPNQ
jgi:hypothetical protein